MPTVIPNLTYASAHPAPGAPNRRLLSLAGSRVTAWLAGIVAVVLVFAAGAAAAPLRTIAAFDPAAMETPENLAIAGDGTIYVSLAFASEIDRIAPRGRANRTLAIPTVGGITAGVAIDGHANSLDVAVRSSDPADGRHLARPACELRAPDPDRRAADRLVPQRDRARLDWEPLHRGLQSRRHLAARARRLTGNAMERESAARADRRELHELPPARGERHQAAPRPSLRLQHLDRQHSHDPDPARRRGGAGRGQVTGIEADDFAFAANGDLYVAENPLSELVRITPSGDVTRLRPMGTAWITRPRSRLTRDPASANTLHHQLRVLRNAPQPPGHRDDRSGRDCHWGRHGSGDERDQQVARDARALARRADQLRARCEALAGSAQDEATRATLARVAGRPGLVGRTAAGLSPRNQGDQ